MSTNITLFLDAVGLFAPSMGNWAQAKTVLCTNHHAPLVALPVPAPTALPPAERRRVGTTVKLALAAGLDALAQLALQPQHIAGHQDGTLGSHFQTVFTSSGGDGDNCHYLCDALAQPERMVSPTKFTNSVHNAPSGYWGIALRAKPASTSVCGFEASFGAGLLDAATQVHAQQTSVLLVSYDTPYPEPIATLRPMEGSMSLALLLSPVRTSASWAQLDVSLSNQAPSCLDDVHLEHLRQNNPSGRALPLLKLLAMQASGACVLAYLDTPNIAVRVQHLSA